MRLVVVSFVGLLAAACDPSPEQQLRDVCTAVCDCQFTSPATINACIDDCVTDTPSAPPQACVDCVYQYSQSCGDLFSECIDACTPQQPQPNMSGGSR